MSCTSTTSNGEGGSGRVTLVAIDWRIVPRPEHDVPISRIQKRGIHTHTHAGGNNLRSRSSIENIDEGRERERERVSRKAFSCFSLWSVTGTWRGESVIRNNNSTFHGKEKLLWEGGGLLAYLRLHLIARFVHCSFRLSLPSPCFVLFPRRGEHLLRNFVRKGEGFRSPYFFSFRFFLLLPFQRLERWRNSNREGILKEI